MDYAGLATSAGSIIGNTVAGAIAPNLAVKTAKKEYGYRKELTRAQMAADKAIAERNISLTQDEGMRNAELVGKKAGMLEGSQKATSAAMGIGGGSVTTANLLEDTRIQANLDKISIRYGADLESWKIQNQLNYSQWENQIKLDQYDYAIKTAKHNAKMSNIALGVSVLFGYAGLTSGNTAQMAMGTANSGGGGMSDSIFSKSSQSGRTDSRYSNLPTQYGTIGGNSINSSNVAPANYYKQSWNPTKLT